MLYYKIILFFIVFLLISPLSAFQSEEQIKVKVIGKVAKFITWSEKKSDNFIITVLNNPFGELFNQVYHGKRIQNRKVQLKYINDINELGTTDILYIPLLEIETLEEIVAQTENKNILTISDIRGFTDRDGILQISFVSQRVKLKINLDNAHKEHLKISSTLLRISDVIQEDKK